MFGIMIDGIWLFFGFAALVISYFVTKDISLGDFLIGMFIWYIGGQWLLDRRIAILSEYIEVESDEE